MDIDTNKAMSKDSMFWIASMSKPITGVAILMLVEEGKLRLTDPVSKFIPEFRGMKVAVMQDRPAGPSAPQGQRGRCSTRFRRRVKLAFRICFRMCPVWSAAAAASAAELAKVARKPGETLADLHPRLGATPLDFQPGSRWSYSPGAGFETLGRVVEIVSGQTFDRFLRQRIFDPLSMKDITFHPAQEQLGRVNNDVSPGE